MSEIYKMFSFEFSIMVSNSDRQESVYDSLDCPWTDRLFCPTADHLNVHKCYNHPGLLTPDCSLHLRNTWNSFNAWAMAVAFSYPIVSALPMIDS